MVIDEPSSGGFPPHVVHEWYDRIGADKPLGDNRSRYLYRAGSEGAANHMPSVSMSGLGGPESFAEIIFWRPLSMFVAFTVLEAPCMMERTEELVRELPSNTVMVLTATLPATGRYEDADRQVDFEYSGAIALVDNSRPCRLSTCSTTDASGIIVPAELLGKEAGDDSWPPRNVFSGSPIVNAAAVFLRTFAIETAARGADVDVSSEIALVDVIRSAIGTPGHHLPRSEDNSIVIREAAKVLIDQNYPDPDFDADAIAEALHVSRRHLYRKLAEVGLSPAKQIAALRLDRARQLLSSSERVNITWVAQASGFSSVWALRNRFRAEYGVTPDEYRRGHRDPNGEIGS